MPLKILITALSSSRPNPALLAEVNIFSAVVASGSEGQRPGGVIHQTEIFDKNIDGGFWRVIAIQDVLHAFSNIQELPAACVTTSYIVSSGIPARAASAIASAATAICTPASS
jgi:hypothetical protein